jgi:hypothetical protein
MELVDLAKYVNSRVGSVFYQEHADRIIEMATQIVAELTVQSAALKADATEKEIASSD